jgi:hypothetical protein
LLGFLACDERKGLALGQVEKSVVDLKLEKIAVYTRVISVGSQCATAGEIQRFGLKKGILSIRLAVFEPRHGS